MHNSVLEVYYAKIPEKLEITDLYPKERMQEVVSCKSDKTKKEKYFVWRLLEYAIENTFSRKMSELEFKKRADGKWICDEFFFSLSHSSKLAAVAVSDLEVGADIELFGKSINDKLVKRVLTVEELSEFEKLQAEEGMEYFTRKWTERESEFKRSAKPIFPPTNTDNTVTETIVINLENEKYCLSVSSEDISHLKIYKCLKLLA